MGHLKAAMIGTTAMIRRWMVVLIGLLPALAAADEAPTGSPALKDMVTELRTAEVLSVFPVKGEGIDATLVRRGVDPATASMVAGLLQDDPVFAKIGAQDRLVMSLKPAPNGDPPDLLALQVRAGPQVAYLLRDDDGGYAVYSEDTPAAMELALATGTAKPGWHTLFPRPLPTRPLLDLALRKPDVGSRPAGAMPTMLNALIRPIGRARMSSGFGWRIHPVLQDTRFHRGVDFAAPAGTPVFAAADGTVDVMDVRGNYGRFIKLRHPRGMTTLYAHLGGFALGLTPGQALRQGQIIGYVGATGLATGPHLYFEVRIDERAIDPAWLLELD